MAAAKESSEQSAIRGILTRVDRQGRVNSVLDYVSIAVCLVLATLLTVKLVGMVVPIAAPSALAVVSVCVVLLGVLLVWTQYGARHLGRAAAVTDDRGNLHDEIKSAYWFMRQDYGTDWTKTQVQRAADTARRLEAKRLVPTIVPQRLWLAVAMLALIVGLTFVPTGGPLLSFAAAPVGSGLTAAQEEQFEDIRALVEQAEALEDVGEEALSAEARERLEEAMRQLEADELTMEELLRELREAQNALDEGNLEMNALEEALAELAQDLEGNTELADLAEAMKNQDLSQAAELMRQLADRLSDLQGQDAQDLMEQLQQAAQGDQASMQELMEALQEAADAMSDEQLADAMQAMQDAAEAMEAMSQRMDAQEMMNQASQQMQAMQQSMSQQQLAQQMMSEQMMASEQPGGEQQEGAMAMPSDDVQKASGSGESGDPSQQEGGPAGHATSDPVEGAEMQLGTPTTLEVQLEMEIVEEEMPEFEEEEPDPEDIFQEASRQQTALVEYENVRGPSDYAEGSALSVERIPWRYRNLVKRYFLAIRPRENQ